MRLVRKIIIIFFLLFLFSSLTKNLLDYRKKVIFYEDYKTAFEKEKKRSIELKTQLLKRKDPYELEKTIRNNLNLSKPGEIAIILPQPTPTPVIVSPTPLPNYLQWWKVFF